MEKKNAARKDRTGDEETWQLSRIYPIIEELIEKLGRHKLSTRDYPCLNEPSPTLHTTSHGSPVHHPAAHSVRSIRAPTWARSRTSDGSSDSVPRHASSDSKKMGQRIFVFIVGGATRSELRICHKLSRTLKREVILGSSSLDDPSEFIMKLKMLNSTWTLPR